MCSDSDPLTGFLLLVPYGDRKLATSTILNLRSKLNDQIELKGSVIGPLQQIKCLKQIFAHTPISLRRSMKSKIFAALEQCVQSSEALAVLAILLVIIETNTLRNSDRSDLEVADIVNTLPTLNSVVSKITQDFLAHRTNLLSLRAWTIVMLVYAYRQCLVWGSHQDCLDLEEASLQERVPLDAEIVSSPSVPKLLKIAFDCQVNNRPPLIPVEGYLLNDLLLVSAFSDSTEKYVRRQDENVCYNMLENRFDSICSSLKPAIHFKASENIDTLPPIAELHNFLRSLDLVKVQKYLQIVERRILDDPPPSDDMKQICKELILGAPTILLQAVGEIDEGSESSADCKSIYCSFLCGFLRVWIYALERRLILEVVPQSYLYLCGFINVRFQAMKLEDFVKVIGLVTQFLTVYLRVFRSNVLASPHWFLQMLSDCVTAIIDRFFSASDEEELANLEHALSPCIASVSRTWVSLRADEPNSRPELSRAVKGILDTIAVRIASTTVSQACGKQKKWKDTSSANDHRVCTALRPQVRQMLNQVLVFPILDVIDPWALQQSRVGLKPAAACEVLRALVVSHGEQQHSVSGGQGTTPSRGSNNVAFGHHGEVVAPVAVGGLSGERLKAKAAAKRQQRIRQQKHFRNL
ncbi:unnamed protein product [Hydatigera taeniaeformis]|uniref:Dilute domain-containing protein n=1 Tax=Hydatigena taeniaeformis TaxID=6205 RepID=A0A0R3WZI8_HYDTA|nr:unnamed protein product [Hydatigera taeniaeformis]